MTDLHLFIFLNHSDTNITNLLFIVAKLKRKILNLLKSTQVKLLKIVVICFSFICFDYKRFKNNL